MSTGTLETPLSSVMYEDHSRYSEVLFQQMEQCVVVRCLATCHHHLGTCGVLEKSNTSRQGESPDGNSLNKNAIHDLSALTAAPHGST